MTDHELLNLATSAADQTLHFCGSVHWKGLSGLRPQLQRSAISVLSNIAEGIGGNESQKKQKTTKGKVRYYLFALGSLRECMVQLELLKRQRLALISRISELSELWSKVKVGLLFVIDGVALEAHVAEMERFQFHGSLFEKLKAERAVTQTVRKAFNEFISTAKGTGDVELFEAAPTRNGSDIYFRLDVFRRFLVERGRRLSRQELSRELKDLGWVREVRGFGGKTFNVWFKQPLRVRKNLALVEPAKLDISEVASG